jgi:hypothetical protein
MDEEFLEIRMPGQELGLYNIFTKVNERCDGKVSATSRYETPRVACGHDPLQFVSGLLSLLELFFRFVGRIYDG